MDNGGVHAITNCCHFRAPTSWILLFFIGVAVAGINWKHVWLEPRETPVVLRVGETQPYTVTGINGADVKAELTRSPFLKITSSTPDVLDLDSEHGVFIAKKPGHADIRLSFSEASEMVPAFVRGPKTVAGDAVDGVWKAVFMGDLSQRPKMVSEIFFALDSNGNALTGTVHAAYWPGDGTVSDGKVDGDRISFTMTGKLPFQAYRVAGYPKLCFSGRIKSRTSRGTAGRPALPRRTFQIRNSRKPWRPRGDGHRPDDSQRRAPVLPNARQGDPWV